MRAGIDLDGVVHDWGRQVRSLLSVQFEYDPGPATHWDYFRDHCTPEQWKWLWSEAGGIKAGLFRGAPLPSALYSIREIQKTQDIVIITGRPKSAIKDTLEWIANYGIEAVETHIVPEGHTKAHVECDWYVDDKIENINDYVAAGRKNVYLFNQPWNERFSYEPRVNGWNDLLPRVMT